MANVTTTNKLLVPAVPALPVAPTTYARQYHDQLNNVLRLYFQQLGGAFQSYLNEGGGRFLSVPCGAFFSNQTFTLSANVATVITLNNTDANGTIDTALSNGSVQVTYPGIYNYQFSAQFDSSDAQNQIATFWVRVDGVDVYESATALTIISKQGSTNGTAVAALNIFVETKANSVIDFVCAVSQNTVRLPAAPASVSPYVRPSIPSLIATVTFVSRLQNG